MATVVSITADKAQEIEDASVVSGHIDSSTGHLLLTTGDGTVIDAGVARPDAAIAAAVLVETNNRIADVNAEEAARIAAITAITNPAPLSLYDGVNFTFSNTAASPTSGGATSLNGTIVVPPSGRLLVMVGSLLRASAGGNPGSGAMIGYELRDTNVSGTILSAFDAARAVINEDNLSSSGQVPVVHTGLTPGMTAYFRMMHQVDTGVTGVCRQRRLIVMGC